MQKTLHVLAFLAFIPALPACSTLAVDVPFVYKIDINQGNIINQDMVNQLRPNMSKRQVVYILGSPLLIDAFNKNRWDYIQSEQAGHDDRVQQRVALFFEGNYLIYLEGDLIPESNPAPVASKEVTVDVPKRKLKKTISEMFMGLFSSES
jgi:outer membrane protein assembly factor BamE